jgi:hypothetical protein
MPGQYTMHGLNNSAAQEIALEHNETWEKPISYALNKPAIRKS